MFDVGSAITFDLFIVAMCMGLLWTSGRLSALHPAVLYLFCHFYSVTIRLLTLLEGAVPISPLHEVLRAGFISDLALIGVTAVFLHLARSASQQVAICPRSSLRMLRPHFVVVVVAITIVIGLPAMWYLRLAGVDIIARNTLGAWSSSSWLWMTITWPIEAAVMWHYIFGYRPVALACTAVLFVITALSASRFAVVIYGVFFCLSFLSSRGLRWPPFRIMVWLIITGVVWFPLKIISASAWAGDDLSTIAQKAVNYTEGAVSEGGGDLQFLDQAAIVMTLVDEHGRYYYGSTLWPLLVSPIPRAWWPEKPALNEYMHEIQTQDRPIAEFGMISMLTGEGYANGGYVGAVLFSMLAAWCYGRAYFAAMQLPHNSVGRFAYLVFLPTLVQVFRDGLVSVVIFNVVASMPMMFVICLHYTFASRQRLALMPAPRLAVGRARP